MSTASYPTTVGWLRSRLLGCAFAWSAGCAAFLLAASLVYAANPEQDVTSANAVVQRALAAARAGDSSGARQAYLEYDNTWSDIEDGVRERSRQSYVAIERAMNEVSAAFAASPPDLDRALAGLTALDREQQAFIAGTAPLAGSSQAAAESRSPAEHPTVSTLIDLLGDAQASLSRADYVTAAARLNTFETTWLDVEGEVKTRSSDAYSETENDMALASTLAAQASPRTGEVVARMATRLEPYREAQQYGIFDAAIILLREGLEALLIVVALSTYLKKSGNAAGQPWLWGGVAGGLVVSVALGFAIQAFFGAIVNASNRELMEGSVGLVAATMLLYVSYWLHSKASLKGWQSYVNERTQQAIQGGRLVGLAVLAFLAVFREGAETALFYLGMVSNISNSDLLIGLGLGTAGLAALAFLMIVVGLRVPMRPFFVVASVLVFYLCLKFVGTGIHAMQVAGVVPAGSASYLPSLDVVGLYPTWPTVVTQAILLVVALLVVARQRSSSPVLPSRRVLSAHEA